LYYIIPFRIILYYTRLYSNNIYMYINICVYAIHTNIHPAGLVPAVGSVDVSEQVCNECKTLKFNCFVLMIQRSESGAPPTARESVPGKKKKDFGYPSFFDKSISKMVLAAPQTQVPHHHTSCTEPHHKPCKIGNHRQISQPARSNLHSLKA